MPWCFCSCTSTSSSSSSGWVETFYVRKHQTTIHLHPLQSLINRSFVVVVVNEWGSFCMNENVIFLLKVRGKREMKAVANEAKATKDRKLWILSVYIIKTIWNNFLFNLFCVIELSESQQLLLKVIFMIELLSWWKYFLFPFLSVTRFKSVS